jgi:CheY-like chemotaxis protein
MGERRKPITIVIAEDDVEDRMFIEEAFAESHLANDLRFVENGEQLMDYLYCRGAYADPGQAPHPGLILLDLNMPKKDGRTALQEIKADPTLRHIPVVILTTSKAEEDVFRSYDMGVNSFVTKPVTFTGLIDIVKAIGNYWFEIVELPPDIIRKRNG